MTLLNLWAPPVGFCLPISGAFFQQLVDQIGLPSAVSFPYLTAPNIFSHPAISPQVTDPVQPSMPTKTGRTV